MDNNTWRDIESVPTDGTPFLAELSNGDVVVLYATDSVRRGARFSWWGSAASGVHIPYAPTHTNLTATTIRLTGWQPLPKSRQEIAYQKYALEGH